MPNGRPIYCDKCGSPIDSSDFYEMTLAHRVIVMVEREHKGRILFEKKSKSHRPVPGVRLCEACAKYEGDRMSRLIEMEVSE